MSITTNFPQASGSGNDNIVYTLKGTPILEEKELSKTGNPIPAGGTWVASSDSYTYTLDEWKVESAEKTECYKAFVSGTDTNVNGNFNIIITPPSFKSVKPEEISFMANANSSSYPCHVQFYGSFDKSEWTLLGEKTGITTYSYNPTHTVTLSNTDYYPYYKITAGASHTNYSCYLYYFYIKSYHSKEKNYNVTELTCDAEISDLKKGQMLYVRNKGCTISFDDYVEEFRDDIIPAIYGGNHGGEDEFGKWYVTDQVNADTAFLAFDKTDLYTSFSNSETYKASFKVKYKNFINETVSFRPTTIHIYKSYLNGGSFSGIKADGTLVGISSLGSGNTGSSVYFTVTDSNYYIGLSFNDFYSWPSSSGYIENIIVKGYIKYKSKTIRNFVNANLTVGGKTSQIDGTLEYDKDYLLIYDGEKWQISQSVVSGFVPLTSSSSKTYTVNLNFTPKMVFTRIGSSISTTCSIIEKGFTFVATGTGAYGLEYVAFA